MDALEPLANGVLLAVFTVVLAWLGKGRFEQIDRRLDQMAAELVDLRREIADLRRDFNAETSQLRRDFNQLVLALGPRPQPQTG